jgi:hypothetical protein
MIQINNRGWQIKLLLILKKIPIQEFCTKFIPFNPNFISDATSFRYVY